MDLNLTLMHCVLVLILRLWKLVISHVQLLAVFLCFERDIVFEMLMYALQEDFFIILHSMLESQTQVSEIHCVKSAKVPLMRFKFNGISIDFPYARIPAISVTEVCIL